MLFEITAAYFLIRIPVWKRLFWRIMQPIGKVDKLQEKKMSSEFFKKSDDSGILLEFWLEYWWETLVANTSDDLRIRQEFQSEFWLELQLTSEFLWKSSII